MKWIDPKIKLPKEKENVLIIDTRPYFEFVFSCIYQNSSFYEPLTGYVWKIEEVKRWSHISIPKELRG